MPPDSIWAPLGVAAPLVAILYYLLRQATEERQAMTKAFLAALTTTVAQSTDAMHAVQAGMREQTSEIAANMKAASLLSEATISAARSATAEHLRIVASLAIIAEKVSDYHRTEPAAT